MMAVSSLLGIDIGTSAVKALVIDAAGNPLASASSKLDLQTPQPGWAEQDPEAWWAATREAARDAVAQLNGKSEIAAIGLSGQMHSSVFLDASGSVIRPALLWCDGRTTAECGEITTIVGEAQLAE